MPRKGSQPSERSGTRRSKRLRPTSRPITETAESHEEDDQGISTSFSVPPSRSRVSFSPSVMPPSSSSNSPPAKRQRYRHDPNSGEEDVEAGAGERQSKSVSTDIELPCSPNSKVESTELEYDRLGGSFRKSGEYSRRSDSANTEEYLPRQRPSIRTSTETTTHYVAGRINRRRNAVMESDSEAASVRLRPSVRSSTETTTHHVAGRINRLRKAFREIEPGEAPERQSSSYRSNTETTTTTHHVAGRINRRRDAVRESESEEVSEDAQQESPHGSSDNEERPDLQLMKLQRDPYDFESDTEDNSSVHVRTVMPSMNEDSNSESLFVSSEADRDSGLDPPSPSNRNEVQQPSSPPERDEIPPPPPGQSWNVSDYFQPPQDGPNGVVLDEVPSSNLEYMVNCMGRRGWTENSQWKRDSRLFKALSQTETSTGSIISHMKELMKYAGSLSRLCEDIPPVADHDAHTTRLQRDQTVSDFANRLHAVDIYVNKTAGKLAARTDSTDDDDKRDAAEAGQKLYEVVIPSLVFLLEKAFMMGRMNPRQESDKLPEIGVFSLSTIRVVKRVTEFIQSLYYPMQNELQWNVPSKIDAYKLRMQIQSRHLFEKPLEKFAVSVEKVLIVLGGRLQEQQRFRQRAMENDRRVRRARAELLQRSEVAKARQIRWHYASIKKFASQNLPQPYICDAYSQLDSASQQQASQARGSRSAEAYARKDKGRTSYQQPSQAEGLMTEEEYVRNNNGWSWDEDSALLTKIRGEFRPDMIELAEEFGRGFDDIQDRIDHLMTLAMAKFQEVGQTPPLWWLPQ